MALPLVATSSLLCLICAASVCPSKGLLVKRLARAVKRQRTIVGKLIRELRGKLAVDQINPGVSPFTLSSLSTRPTWTWATGVWMRTTRAYG